MPDSAVKLSDAGDHGLLPTHHQDEFKRPATAFLSFVALPRLTNAADTAAARARADSVRPRSPAGPRSTTWPAGSRPTAPPRSKGGDLGEWTRGAMDPAFDSAAFAMPLNTLSQPVLSQFGFHLIEMTSRKGKKAKGRHILIPIEVAGAHRDLLDAQADTLERLAGGAHRPGRARHGGPRAQAADRASRGPVQKGTKVQLGNLAVPDAGVWAFQSKPGATSPVIETPIAYYVFRLDSLQRRGRPAAGARSGAGWRRLADDEEEGPGDRSWPRSISQRLAAGSSMAQAAEAMKLPYREFGPFSRIDPPRHRPGGGRRRVRLRPGKRSGLIDAEGRALRARGARAHQGGLGGLREGAR